MLTPEIQLIFGLFIYDKDYLNRKLFGVTENHLIHSTLPKYFASAQKRILKDWARNWGCCFPIGKRPMSPCGGWRSNDKTGHPWCGFEAPSFQVSITNFDRIQILNDLRNVAKFSYINNDWFNMLILFNNATVVL